jgi:hypothetical protein
VANIGVVADTIIGHFAVGTLAGTNNGRISGCYGTGVVIAGREQSNAGGLVGVSTGEVFGSYAAASVDGRENVGGLVGFLAANAGGEISRSFAGGSVRGTNNAGGLVGHAFGGSVRESFSFGRVSGKSGSSVTGGLIGRDFAASAFWNERGMTARDSAYVRAAEVSGSYWDVNASGQASSAGGIGKTSSEMMMRSTFAGWDFQNTWSIVDGVHYPQFIDIPLYTYTLSYVVDSEERGRLRVLDMGAGAAIVDLYGYERKVISGAAAFSVEARPWDGFRFVGWDDGLADPLRSDTAFGDLSLTAVFERDNGDTARYRTFSYAAGAGGKIRIGGVSGLVDHSGELAVPGGSAGPVVAAVPDSGYRFVMWSDGVAGIVRMDEAADDIAATAYFLLDGREFIPVSDYFDLLLIGRVGTHPLDGNYELVSDIDMSVTRVFEPIGTRGAPFRGVFRGNGYRIHGLYMDRRNSDDAGLFGYVENALISGVHLTADVVGRNNVGLLAGAAVNTIIDSCVTEGTVRGASGVGGLAGYAGVTLISRVASTARVDGGESEVGGLIGAGVGSFMALSRFAGSVNGAQFFTGGLAGRYNGGAVQHSYSVGSVTGRVVVGGLIGEASGRAALIQCYSAGSVVGTGLGTGGLAGTLGAMGGGRATACFWDIGRSGRASSALGTGKTSAEMILSSTYAGWDFEDVWDINDGSGYPRLRWFQPPPVIGMAGGPGRARPAAVDRPAIRIIGRTMYVNAPPGTSLRIRIIDMRGRVAAGYDAAGGTKLSLRRIPAGKYIVEAGERGKRKNISTVILR